MKFLGKRAYPVSRRRRGEVTGKTIHEGAGPAGACRLARWRWRWCCCLGASQRRALRVAARPRHRAFQPQTVVSGLNLPTSFAFAPDGRIFIAEKNGDVRVFKNGALLPTPLIDISANVNNYWDRGLIGMALDPNFATNGYIYLLYPYEATASDDARWQDQSAQPLHGGRRHGVARHRKGTSGDRGRVGLHPVPGWVRLHSGRVVRTRRGRHPLRQRRIDVPHERRRIQLECRQRRRAPGPEPRLASGKIIRINPSTGQGLPDNPYWNGDPNAARSKVWAYGVRNAYRFSIRPNGGTPGHRCTPATSAGTRPRRSMQSRRARTWAGRATRATCAARLPAEAVCQTLYAAVAA